MSFACCSDKDIFFNYKEINNLKLINQDNYSNFSLPPYILNILNKKYSIITEENPIIDIEEGYNYANK